MPEQDIVVTLTPMHARHLAGALRVELGMRWESAVLGPAPCREEVERVRALLNDYGEQLERLDWGEPMSQVRVRLQADALRGMAQELRQAASECSADWPPIDDAREMLATADVLDEALRSPKLATTN
jgi:hypothetical protein